MIEMSFRELIIKTGILELDLSTEVKAVLLITKIWEIESAKKAANIIHKKLLPTLYLFGPFYEL